MTLKRALTRWLVLQRSGKKVSTQRYYREIVKMIRKAWRPLLARSVELISEDDVIRFIHVAGHYCPARWNTMVTVLQSTVSVCKVLKRRQISVGIKRMPTAEQFSKLLQECVRYPNTKAALVVNFLAHTGMRITEARQLRWENVFEDRIEAPAETAKNGRIRSIPMVNGIRPVLEALRMVTGKTALVLPQGDVSSALRRACVRAGLWRMTHHDFRHLFATRCVESGVDLPTVARWLGHQDKGVLLARRYFHLMDDHSRRMAEKVRI